MKLSRAGTAHPITRLSPDENDNLSLWRKMPPLDGVNLMEPKRSGTVLLESAGEISRPILTVGGYGKGRVLVLATDYSWKWYMGMVAEGKGNWAYLRLVERMVRWLTKDPAWTRSRSPCQREPEQSGRMLSFGSGCSEEGTISLSVFNPDGVKIGSRLKPAGKPGEYLGSFLPEKGGTYRVKVETRTGHLEESMVIPGLLEDLDGAPNHERLKAISASTGGKILAQRRRPFERDTGLCRKSSEPLCRREAPAPLGQAVHPDPHPGAAGAGMVSPEEMGTHMKFQNPKSKSQINSNFQVAMTERVLFRILDLVIGTYL